MSADYPHAGSYPDRHGKRCWRFRRAGKTIQLPGSPGEPEFDAAYAAALAGRPIQKTEVHRLPTAAAPKSLRPWLVKGPGSRKRSRETELFTGCYQRPCPEVSREANGRSTMTKRGLGVRGLSWAAPAMTARSHAQRLLCRVGHP
jgi:hypothetical protein